MLLIEHGADVNAALANGSPALHEAVKTRFLEIVEALVAAGANVGAKDADGLMALHIAEQLPSGDAANPFNRREVQGGDATPAELAQFLRIAMQNAGIPIEPAPVKDDAEADGSS